MCYKNIIDHFFVKLILLEYFRFIKINGHKCSHNLLGFIDNFRLLK